jgi:hypothetical protein
VYIIGSNPSKQLIKEVQVGFSCQHLLDSHTHRPSGEYKALAQMCTRSCFCASTCCFTVHTGARAHGAPVGDAKQAMTLRQMPTRPSQRRPSVEPVWPLALFFWVYMHVERREARCPHVTRAFTMHLSAAADEQTTAQNVTCTVSSHALHKHAIQNRTRAVHACVYCVHQNRAMLPMATNQYILWSGCAITYSTAIAKGVYRQLCAHVTHVVSD